MDPITDTQSAAVISSRPILNEQNDNNNEQEEQIEQIPKKKELSQKQIDHLNAIRGKALERKREIKLQKHEEYKKQAMEKKVQQIEIKQEPKPEPAIGRQGFTRCAAVVSPRAEPIKQEHIKQEPKQEEAKPKKKVLKKVIKYVEADEDDEDDEEEVIITKPKNKNKQNIKQPEPSNNDLLYQSSLERLQTKILSERAKSIVYSVMPNYY